MNTVRPHACGTPTAVGVRATKTSGYQGAGAGGSGGIRQDEGAEQ